MKIVNFSQYIEEAELIGDEYYINEVGKSLMQIADDKDEEFVANYIKAMNTNKEKYQGKKSHLEMYHTEKGWVSLGIVTNLENALKYIIPMVYPQDEESIKLQKDVKSGSLYNQIYENGNIKYIGISGNSNVFSVIYATQDFLKTIIPSEIKNGTLSFDCEENKVIWINHVATAAKAKTNKAIEGIYTTEGAQVKSIEDIYKDVKLILYGDTLQKAVDKVNDKIKNQK